MAPASISDLIALEVLSQQLSEALASIQDHQWHMSTPCDDWDLAALVDHVTGGNWFTLAVLGGHSTAQAMELTIARFEGGSATVEMAVASVADQLTAFNRPDVAERTWHHVAGDITGKQVLCLRLHDLIVHTWDLTHTLSPPATVSVDLLRWAATELVGSHSLTARHFELVGLSAASIDDRGVDYLSRFGRALPEKP